MIEAVLQHFELGANEPLVEAFGTGLINHTWIVKKSDKSSPLTL